MWLHKGRNQRIGSLRPEIQLHLLLYSSSYIYPDHVLLCDTKPLKPHNLDLDYKTATQSSRKGPYYIKLHSNMNNLNKNRMTMPLFLAFLLPYNCLLYWERPCKRKSKQYRALAYAKMFHLHNNVD